MGVFANECSVSIEDDENILKVDNGYGYMTLLIY